MTNKLVKESCRLYQRMGY